MLVFDLLTILNATRNYRVSILVLVDVGLRPRAIPPPSEAIDVSILVLVDVGLRPIDDPERDPELPSFNPCFSGCWSSTQGYTTTQRSH